MRRMPVVAVGCLAVAAAILAFLVASYTRETIPYEVAEVPLVEEDTGAPAPEEEPAPVDWGALPGSVVAWVRVPGTTVDYPIVQGDEADPDYYLTHDIYGDASVWGAPYVDAGCRDGTRSPFVIVYAHHMSDGTMFGPLEQYADEAFAAAHRTILVYTREGTVELEVFAADVLETPTARESAPTSRAQRSSRVTSMRGSRGARSCSTTPRTSGGCGPSPRAATRPRTRGWSCSQGRWGRWPASRCSSSACSWAPAPSRRTPAAGSPP